MKQNPHITPEGYFSDLKTRLRSIPEAQEVPTGWQRVRPHLAMAAAFIAIVAVGTAILRSTAGNPAVANPDSMSQYELAQLVDAFEQEEAMSEPSEEEIIEYLISTGVTIENIEANETED